jgi:hypothetical protein
MKTHNTPRLLLSSFVIILSLFTSTPARVDEPLLRGVVYDLQGKPVRSADICLYRADYQNFATAGDRRFPHGASRCRKTDKDGCYSLYFPDRSAYILITGKKNRWSMHLITPPADLDTVVTSDTLRPTGSLAFKMIAEQQKDPRAAVSLSGTPFLFTADTAGIVRITDVPAGTYGGVMQSLHKGYRAVRCSLRIRSAENDRYQEALVIPRDRAAFVPTAMKMISAGPQPTPPSPVSVVQSVKAPDTLPPIEETAIKAPPSVTRTAPPVAIAPADTFIGIFEPLLLRGRAAGTVSAMAWDIGGTGKFIPTESGLIELPPFKTSVNRLHCIFKVTDAFGTTATDTTTVYAGLLWMSVSPPKELLGRNGHSLLSFNNELYLIGGNRSDAWSSSDGINWTMLTDAAPFGRIFGHTTVVFNNRLWVFGGKTGNNMYNTAIWSSSTGVQWRREATAPFDKRVYHTAVVFQNKIYCIGGISDSENEPFLNDIWTSAKGTDWNRLTDNAPFGKRYGHGCAVFGDRIVLLGGFNDAIGKRIAYNDVWQSSDGSVWTAITENAPFAKEQFHSVITFDNKLWAIGGYGRDGNTDYFTDVLLTADGTNWTNLTPDKKTNERFFCTATPFGDKIIVSPSDSHKLWIMR